MRFISIALALLLLAMLGSCGSEGKSLDTETTGKFTLSDSEIDAFELSAEETSNGGPSLTSGRLSSRPAIFAEDTLPAAGGKSASVVAPGNGGGTNKCKTCKNKCGKCSKKKKSCGCNGKCKQKCGNCKSHC